MLPSGPGNSRAEFGPSRERSKKLTRVPTGGTATRSFTPELQWRRVDRTDAVERVHMSATQKRKHSLCDDETQSTDAETQSVDAETETQARLRDETQSTRC